jgi:hypothetical protein
LLSPSLSAFDPKRTSTDRCSQIEHYGILAKIAGVTPP